MLNITKEQKNNTLLIRLIGPIDEDVQFESAIGLVPQEIIISCREIPRINSIGVKAWVKYFQTLRQKGVKFTFIECSTAIVEQFNLISNLISGGTVESIYVPFSCTKCKSELIGLFKCEDLKKSGFTLPSLTCSKCSGPVVFDDIPEEYFRFLQR